MFAQPSSSGGEGTVKKFPYRRLQQTVDRFIKVIQIDIDRLAQHKYNVDKYTRYGDHRLLNREHINASRTVQQLKANLMELDRTRYQVEDKDVTLFDRRTALIHNDAAKILTEFIEQCTEEGSQLNRTPGPRDILPPSLCPTLDFEELPSSEEVTQMQETERLKSDHEAMIAAENSWMRLQADLEDLNDLMKKLSKFVQDQQVLVDSIEDNIEHSLADVVSGTNSLSKASRYKTAMYPLAGALLGCTVGGPIGFVAGMKLGMAAALGGGLIGVTSGRLLKRYSDKQIEDDELELQPKSASSASQLNTM